MATVVPQKAVTTKVTKAAAPAEAAGEAPAAPDRPSEPPLVASVRRDLEAAGRVDTIAGQQALLIATQMTGKYHTISGMATVSKELSRVMADALQGANIVADGVDDLRARRDAKRAG